MHRSGLILVLSALLAGGVAHARKPGKKDEAALMALHDAYGKAMMAGDWTAAASRMDAGDLAQFRALFAPLLDRTAGEGGPTVAEALFGGRTSGELAELGDAAFFGTFLGQLASFSPGLAEVLSSAELEEQAVAFDGDRAFVVYAMDLTVEGTAVRRLAVTEARREDGRWALRLSGELEAVTQAIAGQLASAVATEGAP